MLGINRRLHAVMRAEFIHIIRDPLSLFVALIMPLQMLFLFGYTLRFELNEIPVAVCDLDKSIESRDYIEMVDNTTNFKVAYYLTEYRQARQLLDEGRTRCAIIIPAGFSRKIKESTPADIQTIVDASEVNTANSIVNYLSGLNSALSIEMVKRFFEKINWWNTKIGIALARTIFVFFVMIASIGTLHTMSPVLLELPFHHCIFCLCQRRWDVLIALGLIFVGVALFIICIWLKIATRSGEERPEITQPIYCLVKWTGFLLIGGVIILSIILIKPNVKGG